MTGWLRIMPVKNTSKLYTNTDIPLYIHIKDEVSSKNNPEHYTRVNKPTFGYRRFIKQSMTIYQAIRLVLNENLNKSLTPNEIIEIIKSSGYYTFVNAKAGRPKIRIGTHLLNMYKREEISRYKIDKTFYYRSV